MHENLKYTLKLDEGIKEFKSFEGIDSNDKNDRAEISDWQAIYAGNDYGTHYLIYAKFLGFKEGKSFNVRKIQLYVQNYEGKISLGFSNYLNVNMIPIGADDPDNDPRFPNRTKYLLQIALQGVTLEKTIHEFEPENLILTENDILMTSPFFVPIDSKYSGIYDSCKRGNAIIVDEKFLIRMGSNVFVSEEGKSELFRIFLLDDKLITRENLVEAGVDLESMKQKKDSQDDADFDMDETPRYPCIPIYSICHVV